MPIVRAMFAEPNPTPVKVVLAQSGLVRNELRVPMTVVSDGLQRKLAEMAR